MQTSAPWDSNLKTMKNASGKRPPDEAHGPGDETIRPQRSSEAERSSEKKVHHARCSDSASRGSHCQSRGQGLALSLFIYMPMIRNMYPDGATSNLLRKNE